MLASKLGCYLISDSSAAGKGDRRDEMRSDCIGSHQSCYKVRTQSSAKMTHIHCDGAESHKHTGGRNGMAQQMRQGNNGKR